MHENHLVNWLSTIQNNHYSSILISNLQGEEIFRLGMRETVVNKNKLDSTIQLKTYWMDGFILENASGFIHIDLYIPVIINNQVGAVMVFIINPEKDFYPIVKSWPYESETGEALVVKKEDDEIIALSNLRFRNNTAMKYTLPVDIVDKKGFFSRSDYRGEKVLVSTGKIPDTDWLLITKVDQDEIYEVVNMISAFIGAIMIALLIASGSGIAFFARKKEILSFRKLYKIEQEKAALKEHYELLIKYANDIILLMDYDGSIIDINEKANSVYGYSREEMLSMNISDLRMPEIKDDIKSLLNDNGHKDGLLYESAHLKKNGEVMYVEVSSRLISVGERKFIQNIIRDITDRRLSEFKIERLSRVYALLSQINEVIIKESDKQELFKKICDISVGAGKFTAVGIGLLDPETSFVNVVAAGGYSEDYFSNLNIYLTDKQRSEGPTGKAFKEDRYFVVNDIENSPLMVPWREDALQRGYKSLGSFPIKEQERVIGAIMFYSAERDFFDDDEIHLLLEVSKNLSFAIESIDQDKKRKEAEEELMITQFNLKILAANIPETNVYLFNKSLEPLVAEGKELEVFDLRPEDFLNEKIGALFPTENIGGKLHQVFDNRSFEQEVSINEMFYSVQLHPVKNQSGEIYAGIGVFQNITRRKKSEADLVKSQSWLDGFFNLNNVYMAILELRDDDICFIMANRKVAEYYNCSVEELKTKCLRDLAGEDVHNYWIDIYRNINKYKRAVSVEFSMEKNNSVIWLVAEISPIEQVQSNNPLFSYTAFDITERKNMENALRRSEERFRTLFESGPAGIAYGDIEGNITYANDAYLNMIGYTKEELYQEKINWMNITPPEYLEKDIVSLQKARIDGVYEAFEKELIKKDGTRIRVHIAYFLSGENRDEITAFITPV